MNIAGNRDLIASLGRAEPDIKAFMAEEDFNLDNAYGIASTLIEKPGGFLSNDVTPPSTVLDNLPSWEFGVTRSRHIKLT